MKNFFLVAIFAIAGFSTLPAVSQTQPAHVTNGCGSGRIGFLVPNGTLISACKFKNSCDRHDVCYGRCLAGGDLYGNPTCGVVEAKAMRRQVCDTALQRDILSDNGGRAICGAYGAVYRVAVQLLGEQFFNGIDGTPTSVVQLNRFLKFVEENPEAFDPEELQRAFESIADQGMDGVNYDFWLFPGPPARIVARHAGKELFVITGR